METWCLILQVVQGIRTHSSSRHLQLLKNVLILEREKQKGDRALEFHRKRSMIKDTAAKRIMRESLAGKSGEKPVSFTRRMCYGAASGLGSRQFLRGGNEHRRSRKQFPSTIVAFYRSSLLMFLLCPFRNRWWYLQSDRLSEVWFYSRITLFLLEITPVINRVTHVLNCVISVLYPIIFTLWYCIIFVSGTKFVSCKFGLKPYLWFQTKLLSTQFNYQYKWFTRSNQSNFPGGESFRANPYMLFFLQQPSVFQDKDKGAISHDDPFSDVEITRITQRTPSPDLRHSRKLSPTRITISSEITNEE